MHAILSCTYSFIYDSIIIRAHDTCLTLIVIKVHEKLQLLEVQLLTKTGRY